MRSAGKAIAGYFPTPPVVTDALRTLLAGSGGVVRALDPCCGTGAALHALASGLGAWTCGVEVNEGRAAEAATRLDHVLCGDALTMRTSHQAFGLLFLNPPYDADPDEHDPRQSSATSRRLEHTFLKKCTPYLAPGGVLCLLVPQQRVAGSARYLASWYERIGLWRFPDPEYASFGQVVLLATRKAGSDLDPAGAARLVALCAGPLPPLEPRACAPYRVPVVRGPDPVVEAASFDHDAASRAARTGGLWADPTFAQSLWPQEPARTRPLMPLRKGHVAQFGVAGLLDNCVLHDAAGRPFVVKGRAVKEQVTTVIEDDQTVTRVERDVIKTTLSLLDLEGARFITVGASPLPAGDGEARGAEPPTGDGDPSGGASPAGGASSAGDGELGDGAAPGGLAGGETMPLPEFLERFRDGITARILADYRPLYTPDLRGLYAERMALLRRAPRGAQSDVIRACTLALTSRRRCVLVSGEMGCGKTFVAAAAAYLAGKQSILVVCPPHLTRKWQREVEAIIPGARVGIAATPSDLRRILSLPRDRWHGGPLVTVVSRERAKLSYGWIPAVREKRVRRRAADGGSVVGQTLACPCCGAVLVDGEGVPLTHADLARKRLRCLQPLRHARRGGWRTPEGSLVCGAPLWQADPHGPRRVALAEYIKKHLPGAYDLLVLDELHEMKAKGSAQGYAAATLAATIPQTIGLTGTLFGGMATSVFHLLYRLTADVRREFAHTDDLRWASLYGVLERVTREPRESYTDAGARSKRRDYTQQVRERPGIMPSLIVRLVQDTAFLRLSDVATDLPPYTEEVRLYSMTDAQREVYERLQSTLRAELLAALAAGSQRLLGAYLQTLLAWPDTCWREESVSTRVTDQWGGVSERIVAQADALPGDVVYPKEQGLLDLVQHEASRGRRTLVYVAHTEKRDVTGRLATLLAGVGVKVAVLKSDTVPAERREEWIERKVKEGVQALIVHPRCVQTGLDLIAWPTVIFQEVEYSTYVLRQASRRSWRIGQTQPVRVVYTGYASTLQADALALIAAKLRASLLVDGELSDTGLSDYGDDGDFFMELARTVAAGGNGAEKGGLEDLFAQARQVAADLDSALDGPAAPDASLILAAVPRPSPTTGVMPATSGLVTVELAALREAFFASRRPRRVPDAQLTLFDMADQDSG